MVQRGRGAILNVASTAAFQPLPGQAGYGAGKAFVLSYTQSLAGELRGSGVTATTLCPGPVDTGFGERAGFSKQDAENALPKVMWVDRRGGRQGRGRRDGQGPARRDPWRRQPGRRRDRAGHPADAAPADAGQEPPGTALSLTCSTAYAASTLDG